MFFVSEPQSVR